MARSFWLELDGQTVELGEFPLIVGRDPTCDLVLDSDPLVSRRHACFSVLDDIATVEDLRSRNGVYIDGLRIEGRRDLHGGEQVRIGKRQMALRGRAISRVPGPTETTMVDTRKSSPTADTLNEGTDPTTDANIFDLLSGVAEKAFRLGNTSEAERVLRPCLDMVREEAERRGTLDALALRQASEFSCRLANETRDGEWFDYVVRLHRSVRRPPAAHVVDQLYELVRQVKPIDQEGLRAYSRELGEQRSRFGASEKFLVSRIEGLSKVLGQ